MLEREVELRGSMEAVAARDACGGQVSEDYVFEAVGADGSPIAVRLSELLATATTRRSFLT